MTERFDLLRQIAETSGRPVSFTFMQTPKGTEDWRQTLRDIEAANAAGLQIKGQVIPRPTGAMSALPQSGQTRGTRSLKPQ